MEYEGFVTPIEKECDEIEKERDEIEKERDENREGTQ